MATTNKSCGIHIQEACDTWLSTENRSKMSVVKKPGRGCRTPRVFKPLNTSLLEFNFTQTKSVLATKQTNIKAFFKGASKDSQLSDSPCESINSQGTEDSDLPHFISLDSVEHITNEDGQKKNHSDISCDIVISSHQSPKRVSDHRRNSPMKHAQKSPTKAALAPKQGSDEAIVVHSDSSSASVVVVSPSKPEKHKSEQQSKRREKKSLMIQNHVNSRDSGKYDNYSDGINNKKRTSITNEGSFDINSDNEKSIDNMEIYSKPFAVVDYVQCNIGRKDKKYIQDGYKPKILQTLSKKRNILDTLEISDNESDENTVTNDEISPIPCLRSNYISSHKTELHLDTNLSFTMNTNLENIEKGIDNKLLQIDGSRAAKHPQSTKENVAFDDTEFDTVLDFDETRWKGNIVLKRNDHKEFILPQKQEITDSFWSLGSLDSCYQDNVLEGNHETIKSAAKKSDETSRSRKIMYNTGNVCDKSDGLPQVNNNYDLECSHNVNRYDKTKPTVYSQEGMCSENTNPYKEHANNGTVLKRRLKSSYSNKRKQNFTECNFDTELEKSQDFEARKKVKVDKEWTEKSSEITDSFFTLTN